MLGNLARNFTAASRIIDCGYLSILEAITEKAIVANDYDLIIIGIEVLSASLNFQ